MAESRGLEKIGPGENVRSQIQQFAVHSMAGKGAIVALFAALQLAQENELAEALAERLGF